jgi:glucose/arabinose dehydrogenase
MFLAAAVVLAALLAAGCANADSEANAQQKQRVEAGAREGLLVGQGAFGDWTTDAPGVRRRITPGDLPKPYATRSVDAGSRVVPRPEGAWPKAPAGFKVEEFANGLRDGALFVSDDGSNTIWRVSYAGK